MSEPQARAGWTPPVGTAARIRNRAIWAVTLFAASVPPAIVGMVAAEPGANAAEVAMPLALAFWFLGFVLAFWAALPTLRYWEGLPMHVRWLGALPLLCVSLFITAALIGALFSGSMLPP